MARKVILQMNATGQFPVTLIRTRKGRGDAWGELERYSVQYGSQIDSNLTYAQAAAKLGQALMHQAACAGKMD